MPSIVHGPGNREGQCAELPPRPTSPWECLAAHIQGMPAAQLRRVAMLMLRVVCNWRLEDIGTLFKLHKGHVCREVERARLEMLVVLRNAGVELAPESKFPLEEMMVEKLNSLVYARLTPFEHAALCRISTAGGISESRQARLFMLAGGLSEQVRRGEAA